MSARKTRSIGLSTVGVSNWNSCSSSSNGSSERFLAAHPRYRNWKVEYVAIAPAIDCAARDELKAHGAVAEDLSDLVTRL